MKIAEIPEYEKPREKAAAQGIGSLTNAELLALLIRTGTREYSAVEVSEKLLYQCGTLSQLSQLSNEQISMIKGISRAKAFAIQACFEICRRTLKEDIMGKKLQNASDCTAWLKAELGSSANEKLFVLYLNQMKLVSYETMFEGSRHAIHIDIPQLVRKAVMHNSHQIILVHNHPSGDASPSDKDITVTRDIMHAFLSVDITLVDHLIIAGHDYFSFADSGLLYT